VRTSDGPALILGGMLTVALIVGIGFAATGADGDGAGTSASPGSAPTSRSAAPATTTPGAPVRGTTSPGPPPLLLGSGPAKEITAREWKAIARDPDAHLGDKVVVYGRVTQFDSATGPDTFRADVDGVSHSRSYDYDTNTVLTGISSMSPGEDLNLLRDVFQDDLFRAEVTVLGSLSYETQIGGQTTVPQLLVHEIEVTGSAAL
jgi:hypothetical protein